jgi:hypothetical protein
MNPGIRGLPTQLSQMPRGLLGAPTPIPMPNQSWHVEALDWANRARRNGGQVTDDTISAVSRFCNAADDGDFRSVIYRLNLFCGSNLAACLVPLYRGPKFGGTNYGSATETNVNFVSADFVERGTGGGLKGSLDVVKYLDTGFPTTSLPNGTSIHLSVSATGLSTTTDFIVMGSYSGGGPNLCCIDENTGSYGANGGRSARIGTLTGGEFPFTKLLVSDEKHFIGTRQSATSCVIFREGQSIARRAQDRPVTRITRSIHVFRLSDGTVPTSTSRATVRMYSVGTGLDGTKSAAFSAAVIDFNNDLGR